MTTDTSTPGFNSLGLSEPILKALDAVGYETPSPIQAAIIPHVLEGRDVLGQAQTGTGKTAAFALPLLSRLNLKNRDPQVLVLAPTRELAIQVAEAFQKYAAQLPGFHVLPIYGGQAYSGQLRALKRGVHVVVGTPGRVVDHMKRGTLKLDSLQCLVLDEADEMLRMGFVDDVEWVLSQTPEQRQIALFSATMPAAIRRIAKTHLSEPEEITIEAKTRTADNIRQRMWPVSGMHKLDALTRILEGEDYDGVIVFARTKLGTVELADKLAARGHEAVAINGDMDQRQRERTVEQFKAGKLDILVATDVVARGIDVDRVSHVINYDIPYDTESYVHRIGRTGRAGRKGEAILFVAPRERRMLGFIERATKQKIERMDLPSVQMINDKRVAGFKQRIVEALAVEKDRSLFERLISEVEAEQGASPQAIAAVLAGLLQGDQPLLLEKERKAKKAKERFDDSERPERRPRRERTADEDDDKETFRIAVGHEHGVKPSNIVGAIANEAGLDSQFIGRIDIRDNHSYVDLPMGMPKDVFKDLKKVWVSGQQLQITRVQEGEQDDSPGAGRKPQGKPMKRRPGTAKGRKTAQRSSKRKAGNGPHKARGGKKGPGKK
ncbi:MAG: DEAD/DEAH box helicase [Nevskiales bacterium]